MTEPDDERPLDEDLKAVDAILAEIKQSGYMISRNWIVNLFIAIKSKPLLILAGPPESNKELIMERICQYLTGGEPLRYQPMVGHPWWAGQFPDGPAMIQAQSKFNTLKIENLLEEAALPDNKTHIFIAALKKMCAGELQEFFSETAFQIKNHQITRLPRSHFAEPVPFPNNLFFFGTIDANRFQWFDRDLLSQTSIIQCPPLRPANVRMMETTNRGYVNEERLLRSCTREPQLAFKKLIKVVRKIPGALQPYFATIQVLQKVLPNPSRVQVMEGIIYLSNAWGNSGRGLYSPNPRKNLERALDFAITQSLLLPGSEPIAGSRFLQEKLQRILEFKFPRSEQYLIQMSAR